MNNTIPNVHPEICVVLVFRDDSEEGYSTRETEIMGWRDQGKLWASPVIAFDKKAALVWFFRNRKTNQCWTQFGDFADTTEELAGELYRGVIALNEAER